MSNRTTAQFNLMLHVAETKNDLKLACSPALINALRQELAQVSTILNDFETNQTASEIYLSMAQIKTEFFEMLPAELIGWAVGAYAEEAGVYPGDLLTGLISWNEVEQFA